MKKKLRKTEVIRGCEFNRLIKAKQNYDEHINNVYRRIKPFVRFDFFIMHQQGDGFVLVHQKKGHNATLSSCINVIQEYGFLDYDNYPKLQAIEDEDLIDAINMARNEPDMSGDDIILSIKQSKPTSSQAEISDEKIDNEAERYEKIDGINSFKEAIKWYREQLT